MVLSYLTLGRGNIMIGKRKIDIPTFGYAVGVAGRDSGTAFAPIWLQKSPFLQDLTAHIGWQEIYYITQSAPQIAAIPAIADVCAQLAQGVFKAVQHKKPFLVIGGDHSSAIGTWSGASQALSEKGDLGLIWMDAHLDSHTLETTPSGNVHGMSLAILLGHGEKHLTKLMSQRKKLKPQNVCIIGPRSFESEEVELLKKMGVKIYFDGEVHKRGLKTVFAEAVELVTAHTVGFGVSLDIDLFNPKEAPAVGVPEPGGLCRKEFLNCVRDLAHIPHFIGLEIVEFNPLLDKTQKTEKLIAQVIEAVFHKEKTCKTR
jgi:arginase